MAQHYSDPARADDPHALPDLETFEACAECGPALIHGVGYPTYEAEGCTNRREGWFYWFCLPGCMPDSDPVGPFPTEAAALADARGE